MALLIVEVLDFGAKVNTSLIHVTKFITLVCLTELFQLFQNFHKIPFKILDISMTLKFAFLWTQIP